MNLPTFLTWSRIALIPVLVGTLYLPEGVITARFAQLVAAGIFVACGVTDWLDGYLARAMKLQTQFGAFLDPVADKLLVCATLIVLVHIGRLHSIIAIIIIGREIAVSALREWMAQVGRSKSVAVASIGKIKTVCQMASIPFLLCDFKLFAGITTVTIGTPLIAVAAVLTVWSMVYYIRAASAVPPTAAKPAHPASAAPVRAVAP
jgi:cardiolipin synthase